MGFSKESRQIIRPFHRFVLLRFILIDFSAVAIHPLGFEFLNFESSIIYSTTCLKTVEKSSVIRYSYIMNGEIGVSYRGLYGS